ncbi:uncharacterized protein LOC142532268 [Primulina tabacum]|uniref:uncharacterized protein LOC142532268 n=1 Tax=Primulina tabacum TaxID=48773 RepID=UPI003F590498
MRNILREVGKLRGCIRQIETLRPSGASEEDILNRAKNLFMQDADFSKGFKYDHVWYIMKDMEKFSSDINPMSAPARMHVTSLDSSQSDSQTPNTPISGSPGLPPFSINLSSDENAGGTSSQRPLSVKKSKLKKKRDDNVLELISTMKEGHRDLINVLQKGSTELQQSYEMKLLALQNEQLKLANQQKKIETRQQQIALATLQEENKVLYMDLSTIDDPEMREIVPKERAKILKKRNEEHGQHENDTFGKYFGDFGGSRSNLGDY